MVVREQALCDKWEEETVLDLQLITPTELKHCRCVDVLRVHFPSFFLQV